MSAPATVIEVTKTLCHPDRLEVLGKYAFLDSFYRAELWELGVYHGGSAQVLAHFAKTAGLKLKLFDSFEGIPEPTDADEPEGGVTRFGEVKMHKGEWCQPSIEAVRARLPEDCDVEIYKGWVPEVLDSHRDSVIGFAHVDLDLYEGTLAALNFIFPRLVLGGHIIVDDFCYGRNPGIERAVMELPSDAYVWMECPNQAVIRKQTIIPGREY